MSEFGPASPLAWPPTRTTASAPLDASSNATWRATTIPGDGSLSLADITEPDGLYLPFLDPRLFERFVRVASAHPGKIGGPGEEALGKAALEFPAHRLEAVEIPVFLPPLS